MKHLLRWTVAVFISTVFVLMNVWSCSEDLLADMLIYLPLALLSLVMPLVMQFSKNTVKGTVLTAVVISLLYSIAISILVGLATFKVMRCIIAFLSIFLQIFGVHLAAGFVLCGIHTLCNKLAERKNTVVISIISAFLCFFILVGAALGIVRPVDPRYNTDMLMGLTVEEAQARYGDFDNDGEKACCWRLNDVALDYLGYIIDSDKLFVNTCITCYVQDGVITRITKNYCTHNSSDLGGTK